MPDLTKLSANKLHAEIAKREAKHSALLRATIEAGYGNTRHNEIVATVKAGTAERVLVDYLAASDALELARYELDARRRYHGGDKPIRRLSHA